MQASEQDKRVKPVVLIRKGEVLQRALVIVGSIDAEFFSILQERKADDRQMMQLLLHEHG